MSKQQQNLLATIDEELLLMDEEKEQVETQRKEEAENSFNPILDRINFSLDEDDELELKDYLVNAELIELPYNIEIYEFNSYGFYLSDYAHQKFLTLNISSGSCNYIQYLRAYENAFENKECPDYSHVPAWAGDCFAELSNKTGEPEIYIVQDCYPGLGHLTVYKLDNSILKEDFVSSLKEAFTDQHRMIHAVYQNEFDLFFRKPTNKICGPLLNN